MPTRRQFVRHSALAGASLALGAGCAPAGPRPPPQPELAGFEGELLLPGDRAYDTARTLYWNSATTEGQPALIARCSSADDVRRCLHTAQQHDLPLSIKGGGHSFAGWGLCDHGLTIDTASLRDIEIDPHRRTVTVGAGVTTAELVKVAARYGLAPALGQCPGVGVAGLTLGGGLGWLSARHGAACDNLLAVQLVTPDGRLLRVDTDHHPELLWGLRGGGGNFGVVTAMSLALHPQGEVVAGRLDYDYRDARALLQAFENVMASAPPALQASLSLARGERDTVSVLLCWSGEPELAQPVLAPLYTPAQPLQDSIRPRPFADTFALYPGGRTRYSALQGCYLQALTPAAADTLLQLLEHSPGPGCSIGLDHYMHGAVCRQAASAAFESRRPGSAHLWLAAEWNRAAEATAMQQWIDAGVLALQPYCGERDYANFPARREQHDPARAYPGNHRRLAALKAQYDPTNLLRRNYNIPPAGA